MAAQRIYDLRGRVCLITGATSGIGRETARGLAQSGASVLLVARDRGRGAEVAAEIQSTGAPGSVELLIADLACRGDVRALAGQISQGHDRLDAVIHNAGAVNTSRQVTAEGIEATLAVNHLAPFLLTDLLAPLLQATPSSRVVTVSSYMHTRVKDIPWDDLQAEHHYSAAATYNLTKLLNVLFTYELARRWAGTSVTANALHPGWPLKTNLGRDQSGPGAVFDRATKLVGSSAAKGARTSLYLAGSPDVTAVTGQYFSRCRPAKSSALTHNTAAAKRLWAHSAELCGLPAS
ncbi:MAG: SDR family NAD(P)-dependent oxidoreductase [Actinomycetota bacterium]|nr:SDR family NAD(P)-dependent oxidoreductase [Actinomycetota bacterium]